MLKIVNPTGVLPREESRFLPDNAATEAENCDFSNGALRGLRADAAAPSGYTFLGGGLKTDTKTIYIPKLPLETETNNLVFQWPSPAHVVDSPTPYEDVTPEAAASTAYSTDARIYWTWDGHKEGNTLAHPAGAFVSTVGSAGSANEHGTPPAYLIGVPKPKRPPSAGVYDEVAGVKQSANPYWEMANGIAQYYPYDKNKFMLLDIAPGERLNFHVVAERADGTFTGVGSTTGDYNAADVKFTSSVASGIIRQLPQKSVSYLDGATWREGYVDIAFPNLPKIKEAGTVYAATASTPNVVGIILGKPSSAPGAENTTIELAPVIGYAVIVSIPVAKSGATADRVIAIVRDSSSKTTWPEEFPGYSASFTRIDNYVRVVFHYRPEYLEARAYCYTYVNKFGEEGPPSDPLLVEDYFPGRNVYLAFDMPENYTPNGGNLPLSGRAVDYANIKSLRLYRTAPGGNTYQFVREYRIVAPSEPPWPQPNGDTVCWATTGSSYPFCGNTQGYWLLGYDSTPSDALGEPLPAIDYLPPDQRLRMLCSVGNGVLAGAIGNEVRFSSSYLPYAWPRAYAQTLGGIVTSLTPVEGGLLATTTTHPYLITGVDPANMTATKLSTVQPGMGPYASCLVNGGVAFASSDGIAFQQGLNTTTEIFQRFFTKQAWLDRFSNLDDLRKAHFFYHDGGLLIWFENQSQRALYFRLEGEEPSLTYLDNSFAPRLMFYDKSSDALLYANKADTSLSVFCLKRPDRRPFTWVSKRFAFPYSQKFAWARIKGHGKLSVDIYTQLSDKKQQITDLDLDGGVPGSWSRALIPVQVGAYISYRSGNQSNGKFAVAVTGSLTTQGLRVSSNGVDWEVYTNVYGSAMNMNEPQIKWGMVRTITNGVVSIGVGGGWPNTIYLGRGDFTARTWTVTAINYQAYSLSQELSFAPNQSGTKWCVLYKVAGGSAQPETQWATTSDFVNFTYHTDPLLPYLYEIRNYDDGFLAYDFPTSSVSRAWLLNAAGDTWTAAPALNIPGHMIYIRWCNGILTAVTNDRKMWRYMSGSWQNYATIPVTIDKFFDILYGGGVMILPCGGATIKSSAVYFSLDYGVSWHAQAAPIEGYWVGTIFKEDRFIIVDSGGQVAIKHVIPQSTENTRPASPPGTTFSGGVTARLVSDADAEFKMYAYGEPVFVRLKAQRCENLHIMVKGAPLTESTEPGAVVNTLEPALYEVAIAATMEELKSA